MGDELRSWIEKELTLSNSSESLSMNKEKVKKLLRITREGNIHITADRTKLSDKDLCYLFLVGKAYAYYANYIQTDEVTNKEVKDALKITPASVDKRIEEMRNEGLIEQSRKWVHRLIYPKLSEMLEKILQKLEGLDNVKH